VGDSAARSNDDLLSALARRLPPEPRLALELLTRHGVPAAAVADLGVPGGLTQTEAWQAAIGADHARAARMQRATSLVQAALQGLPGVALAGDGLGPMWSSDVDVFVAPERLAAAGRRLTDAGMVCLDGLLLNLAPPRRRQHRPTTQHFAVVDGTDILAAAELCTELCDGGPSAEPAIARAVPSEGLARLTDRDAAQRRMVKLRSARRPTARGAIEMSLLLRRGHYPHAGAAVLHRYAGVEREIAGPGPLTAAAAARRPGLDPVWAGARLSSVPRVVRARARPNQVRIAFSGIDGSGKSTQVTRLVENLGRVGIPAHPTWTRIGSGASRPVTVLAAAAQRALPSRTHSFQATRIAAGRGGPPRGAPPMTRRGVLGWLWALTVTLDYLCRARAGQRRARGAVLVLDRALPDALVELREDYGLTLRLAFQRRLLERMTAPAHRTFYLRLEGAAAKARKDDDFTAAELDAQTLRYGKLFAGDPGVVELDAEAGPDQLALEILRAVAAGIT